MKFLLILSIAMLALVSARPTFDKIAEMLLNLVDEETQPHSYGYPPAAHTGAYEHGYHHHEHHYGAGGLYPDVGQHIDGHHHGAGYNGGGYRHPYAPTQTGYGYAPQRHPDHGIYPGYQSPPYANTAGYGYQQPYPPTHGYQTQGY